MCGLCASDASAEAISGKTIEILKEIIGVSDKAEEDLKTAKKELEDALNEYFAAMRLMGISEPTREVGVRSGCCSCAGDPYYKGVTKKYKDIIQKDIGETYDKVIAKNKAQKGV